MPKMRKKDNLPPQSCATCGLPIVWRRKGAKVWDEVKYCSDLRRVDAKKARP